MKLQVFLIALEACAACLAMHKVYTLLKGLCHGSPVHFVLFCQLLALNRYGT